MTFSGVWTQKLGQLTGAEYIITGEINTTNGQLRIDSHLIKVVSGQILGEKVAGADERSIEPMIKLLADNFIYNLTGKGEHKEFKKIKRYFSNWALISTGALAISTSVLHFMYKHNYDLYHQNEQLDKFDYYYKRANRNYKARNIMLAITGVAALTTLTLWQQDQSEGNKIYACSDKFLPNKKLALGIVTTGDNYMLSVNFQF